MVSGTNATPPSVLWVTTPVSPTAVTRSLVEPVQMTWGFRIRIRIRIRRNLKLSKAIH